MGPYERSKNVYDFIRLLIGDSISDRAIARRWGIPWRSFLLLKKGERLPPRISDLSKLADLLGVDPIFVFEAARGTAATMLQTLLERRDQDLVLETLFSQLSWRHQHPTRDLRLTLSQIGDAAFTIDLHGHIIDMNPWLSDLTGYDRATLRGMCLWDLGIPEERPQLAAQIAEVYSNGVVRGIAMRWRLSTGAIRDVVLTANRIDDPDGHTVGLQATARLSSGRGDDAVAEEAWVELLALAPLFIAQVNAAGQIIRANGASTGALEPNGSLLEFVDPDYHPALKASLQEVRESGRTILVEVGWQGEQGPRRHLAHVVPLIRSGDEVDHVLVIAGEFRLNQPPSS